jgi:hypothetical protein
LRARRAADRLLVDHDHLVDLIEAGERAVRADPVEAAVELPRQRRVQGRVDQR